MQTITCQLKTDSAANATSLIGRLARVSIIAAVQWMVLVLTTPPAECNAGSEESVEAHNVQPPLGVELGDIIDVWTRRAERIRTAVLEWEGEITYGKDSLFWSPGQIARHGGDAEQLPHVPESDVTFHTRGRLAWDRARKRFKLQHDIPTWNAESGRHFQQDVTQAMDVDTAMSFLSASKIAPLQLRGHVRARRENEGPPGNVEVPLAVTALFPFGETLSLVQSEDDWSIVDRQIVVGGHACLVLERRRSDFRTVRTDSEFLELLVVDPAMDFSIVRHSQLFGGVTQRQRDFEYVFDNQHGWLSAGWKSLLVGKDHQLIQQFEHAITRRDINGEIRDEDLELAFPVDTWVRNVKNDQQWVVREHGVRRITPAELERGATHAELIASDSGNARNRGSYARRFPIVAIVFIFGCAYFAFKRSSIP